jgi:hypothetical protein
MKKLLLLSVAVLIFFSCGKKVKVFYPKFHYVSTYKTQELKKEERVDVLVWGNKLELEQTIYITNVSEDGKKISINVVHKVFNPLTKSSGYVSDSDVVKNPITKGVLIRSTTASETPNLGSFVKVSLKPFIPVYLLDISEDKELYQIIGYTSKLFVLPEDEANVTPIWKPLWVYKNDISTNKNDVELLVVYQLSVKRYKDMLAQYNKEPEKNAVNMTNVVKRESDEIRIALDKYKPASPEITEYVGKYKALLDSFIYGSENVEEEDVDEEVN